MTNNKNISPLKVAVAGAALAAGTYAAVKLAKKENREKVKKLINKYTKGGEEIARKAIAMADKVQDIKKMVKEDGATIKKQIKKV